MSTLTANASRNQAGPQSAVETLKLIADRTLSYDFTVWFWGDAIAFDGLLEGAELVGDARYSDFCLNYIRRWSKQPLTWVDHLAPGGALVKLSALFHDESLINASYRLADLLLSEAPRSPRTNFPLYRPDLPSYRHTVWVDSIYHVPIFLCELAIATRKADYFDKALEEWKAHERALSSGAGPFLGHAYDSGANLVHGYGWGRGNGWALLGIVDVLELLPRDHPGFPAALQSFQRLSSAVLGLQDKSGFWRTLLHDREAYLEASTASFFGATFTKGVRLGLLNDDYAQAAELAWRAMLSRIDAEGSFYGVSACTWAAVSPGDEVTMYRTLPTEANVWGQGSALRFAAERIRFQTAREKRAG